MSRSVIGWSPISRVIRSLPSVRFDSRESSLILTFKLTTIRSNAHSTRSPTNTWLVLFDIETPQHTTKITLILGDTIWTNQAKVCRRISRIRRDLTSILGCTMSMAAYISADWGQLFQFTNCANHYSEYHKNSLTKSSMAYESSHQMRRDNKGGCMGTMIRSRVIENRLASSSDHEPNKGVRSIYWVIQATETRRHAGYGRTNRMHARRRRRRRRWLNHARRPRDRERYDLDPTTT